jgi:ABC-type molybdate transport system substrate-binding protein
MVAVISDSERKPEARAFVDRLLSDEGAEALESAGFGTP